MSRRLLLSFALRGWRGAAVSSDAARRRARKAEESEQQLRFFLGALHLPLLKQKDPADAPFVSHDEALQRFSFGAFGASGDEATPGGSRCLCPGLFQSAPTLSSTLPCMKARYSMASEASAANEAAVCGQSTLKGAASLSSPSILHLSEMLLIDEDALRRALLIAWRCQASAQRRAFVMRVLLCSLVIPEDIAMQPLVVSDARFRPHAGPAGRAAACAGVGQA